LIQKNNMKKTGEKRLRLYEKYQGDVSKTLIKEMGIKNKMAVPRVEKVVVNVGIGAAIKNKELMESIIQDISLITGQRPSVQKARISVASFGVRRGMPVGLRVTLRGKRMYDFLDKLFSIVLPRLRDFRGLSRKSFDGRGNYTLGLEEQTVFPEIDTSKTVKPFGLEISIITNAKDDKSAGRLLELLGMPFEKND